MSQLGYCLQCHVKLTKVRRGLCYTCYDRSLVRIRKGLTSWDQLIQNKKALPPKPASNHWLSKKKQVREQLDQIPRCIHDKNDGECPICEGEQRAKVFINEEYSTVNIFSTNVNSRRELTMHIYKTPEGFGRGRLR